MSPRAGLRAVADALAWYGEASTDQLAVELGLGRAERPALEAALHFWVERGEAREVTSRGAPPGACASGCGGCPAARGTAGAAVGKAAGARVWRWVEAPAR